MTETQEDVTNCLHLSTSPDELEQLRQQAKAVLAITANLMERLNERDIQLEQEEELHNKTIAERDEARRYAAGLQAALDRAKQREFTILGWLQERLTGTDVIYEDDLPHYCGDCGTELQHVRPGKWQCDVCQ